MFNQGSATFDPIAVVAIRNAVDLFDLGMMDMTTDDAINPAVFGEACHFLFIIRHELNGVLDFMLQVF